MSVILCCNYTMILLAGEAMDLASLSDLYKELFATKLVIILKPSKNESPNAPVRNKRNMVGKTKI